MYSEKEQKTLTDYSNIMRNESQNIEYKSSWRDEYLKWICGFANANGGVIYIGVNDKKEVIGVKNINRLMEDIPNKIVTNLGIVADVDILSKGNLEYIKITVTRSNMPIAYKGQYHYRSGSTKQELKGVALQQFIMKKMGHSWDDIPLEHATINDIDRSSIDYFLRKSIVSGRTDEDERDASTEDVLRNLGLITGEGKLKNAAILLFGKHVRQFFPAADFKIGRFHSNESDLITQDVIDCNIIKMASKVVEILRSKYLISPIHYEGLQRIEELEIPEIALRELIYNSIAHKDYMGPSIQMRIYDKSVELWNYGLLPEELTPEDLMRRHASYPRNKNIAYTFFKAGFIESWGRSFKKIQDEFKRTGLQMPTIQEIDGGVIAIIKRRTVDDIIASRNDDVSENDEDNLAEIKLTNRQHRILSLIVKRTDITAKQMADITDIPKRTIERELSIMQKIGIIKRIGAPRTGSWSIAKLKNL